MSPVNVLALSALDFSETRICGARRFSVRSILCGFDSGPEQWHNHNILITRGITMTKKIAAAGLALSLVIILAPDLSCQAAPIKAFTDSYANSIDHLYRNGMVLEADINNAVGILNNSYDFHQVYCLGDLADILGSITGYLVTISSLITFSSLITLSMMMETACDQKSVNMMLGFRVRASLKLLPQAKKVALDQAVFC